MISLYLARHGETIENISHILQGHLPGTLTEKGIDQICTLREQLSQTPLDLIISSDLARSIHSAQIINKDRALTHIQTPLLRERDWGSLTGESIFGIRNKPIPEDVESIDQLLERAGLFIDFIRHNYAGMRILAVGHGLINRAIQAYLLNKDMADIERMSNAEVRMLVI